jgi:O-succinylbenzoic acid--CoA ligase
LHTLGNHIANALGANECVALGPGDRWLLTLPLYHVGGLGILFRCFLGGGAVVIPSPSENLLQGIEKYKITHVSLVATQFYRLLKLPRVHTVLRRLKAILVGGGPIAPALIQKSLQLKLPIFTTYGLTEMASQVATTTAADLRKGHLTGGKVLKFRRVKISKTGEILVRGKTLFQGYIQGRKVIRPLQKGGWFATGDLGEITADGRLKVLGRKDNMFISGGENIYPEEIERHLLAVPGVEEAVVVPCADDEFGQRPAAFIRMNPARRLNAKIFNAILSQRLAKFKIPLRYYSWPFEKISSWKMGRGELLQHFKNPRQPLCEIK